MKPILLTRVVNRWQQMALARQSQIEAKRSERPKDHSQRLGRGGGSIWQSRSLPFVTCLQLGLIILLLFSCALFGENKTTSHLIQLEKGPLVYTATVGSLPVKNKNEKIKAEIGYTAYVKEGSETNRPLTFAFNGGPGSSSIWLHAAAFGPRRIVSSEEGQAIASPYRMIDNLETILDLTDLVFIDPIGTGFSQEATEEGAAAYYDLLGDIRSIGDFIRDYLTANNRWNSPKYIAGESYGALRACGLADYLQDFHSIYLNGLILISSAIDYQTFVFNTDNQISNFLFLPTYAATAWHHGRFLQDSSIEEAVSAARRFAYETYAPAMLKSFSLNSFEKEKLFDQLSQISGISLETVRRSKGRITERVFKTEFFGSEQKILGMYDTRLSGDYSEENQLSFAQDPSVTALSGIVVGAFHDYLQNELGSPGSYLSISFDVNSAWNYSYKGQLTGYPNMMKGLRQALIINPSLKVFAGCGYFDCVTPFAATEYCLNHLDLPDAYKANFQIEYYEGGHMYYLNPAARIKFKNDLIRFYQEN